VHFLSPAFPEMQAEIQAISRNALIPALLIKKVYITIIKHFYIFLTFLYFFTYYKGLCEIKTTQSKL